MTLAQVQGAAARRSWLGPLEPALLLLLLVSLLVFRGEIEELDFQHLCLLASGISSICVVLVAYAAPRRLWSPSTVFFVTFAVFHCGLLLVVALGSTPEDVVPTLRAWLYRPSTRTAIWLVTLASVALAAGARLAHLMPPARFRAPRFDEDINEMMSLVGLVLVMGSIAAWFFVALTRGGPALLVGSYNDFLRATADTMLPYAYYAMGTGIVLTAAARRTRFRKYTIAAFVVWSLVAFPLGLRGEILFPAFAAFAIISTRRRMPSAGRTALVAIVLLTSIAAARQIRMVGVRAAPGTQITVNPLDGLAELGASLRPASEVVFWRDLGEPLAGGATYWAPFDRVIFYFVPGWSRPPAEDDERLMNVTVMRRVGPIGFSPVAEAYWNFGKWGVMVVMFVFGFVLGRLDTWPDMRTHQAIVGMLLIGLLNHVRNSFVPVPAQIITGLLTIAAIVTIVKVKPARDR